MPSAAAKSLKRLVKHLVEKGVVPFVGAGFSYGATHPTNGDLESKPCLMIKQLQKCIDKKLAECLCDGKPEACTVHALRCDGQNSVAQLAELGVILFGMRHVCEELQIHEYAVLKPQPQHRYLVYLVREGVINEIITTNYDCCIENAFQDSLDSGKRWQDELGVVRNLAEYRHKGSKFADSGKALLYKINGCSGDYSDKRSKWRGNPTPEHLHALDVAAERIIFTERQLQTFRGESWARELLRDRFRRRHFFFSGFGSGEPQIRHTALTLIEEFSDGGGTADPKEVMGRPSAPFIHSHKYGLSFYQHQILLAYLDAQSPPRVHSSPLWARIAPIFDNIIGPDTPGGECSATDVWREIFVGVFIELVRQQLKPERRLGIWLRQQHLDHRQWLAELRGITNVLNSFWHSLLTTESAAGRFPLRLWRYLQCMRSPGVELREQNDWYLPLNDEPLSILLLVLLMRCLLPAEPLPKVTSFGVRLSLNADAAGGERRSCKAVYLIDEQAKESLVAKREAESGSRLLRFIIVPSVRESDDCQGRWREWRDGDRGRILTVGLWVAVPTSDLLQQAGRPDRLRSVRFLRQCFAATPPRKPAARIRVISPTERTL